MSGKNVIKLTEKISIKFEIIATVRGCHSRGTQGISTLLVILYFLSWVLCIRLFD